MVSSTNVYFCSSGGVIVFNISDHFCTRPGFQEKDVESYCQPFISKGEWAKLTKRRATYNTTEKGIIFSLFKA